MSTTETALTAHLVKQYAQDDDAIIAEATRALHSRFGIQHTTLLWERGPGRVLPPAAGLGTAWCVQDSRHVLDEPIFDMGLRIS